MNDSNNERPVRPFVDVDQAREKPRRLEELESQPDTGGVIEEWGDDGDVNDDPADGVPGEKEDIYARGVTIMPPG